MKKLGKHKTNDVSYTYSAPTGVPGDVTRIDQSNIEPCMLVAPLPAAYGLAMVLASGGEAAWGSGSVAANFDAVLVRQAPGIAGTVASDSSLGGVPNSLQVQGKLVRGYVNVVCQYGTPARGGIVYVCITASTGRVVGGFEATFDSGNNLALSLQQAEWAVDGKDAFNNSELRIQR